MIELVYYRVNSGSYPGGTYSYGTWSPQPGDLLVCYGTNTLPSFSSGVSLLRSYTLTSFGYYGNYTFRANVYYVVGTPSEQSPPRYCGISLWRPSYPMRYVPQDLVFHNDVPAGQGRNFPSQFGVWIADFANTSWAAEWNWYPTITGNIDLKYNLRCHDSFIIGGVASPGTITGTAYLLSRVDMAGILIVATPLLVGSGDFVMV